MSSMKIGCRNSNVPIDYNLEYMVSVANECAQVLSEEVRKRTKSSKEIMIVEALDRVVDILGLGMGKGRTLKSLGQSERS